MFKLSKVAGSVIAAAAIFGGTGAVLADGYSPRGSKVVYDRPTNWSGFYFGVQSGYQWSQIDGTYSVGTSNSIDHDSALVGTFLGYQHQFGAVVLGVEGNWLSTLRDTPGEGTCPNPAFNCTHRLNDILSVGGRLGFAAGHWMPYVTGGYASARFEFTANTIVPAAATAEQASTRNDGWYIGGGFEWNVSPGWTAGLEYRHYEFDAVTDTWYRPATGAVLGTYSMDASVDTITARVAWRWGRPEAARPLK